MSTEKKTKLFTSEVLRVYQKVNPSIHFILNKRDFEYREKVKLNILNKFVFMHLIKKNF